MCGCPCPYCLYTVQYTVYYNTICLVQNVYAARATTNDCHIIYHFDKKKFDFHLKWFENEKQKKTNGT